MSAPSPTSTAPADDPGTTPPGSGAPHSGSKPPLRRSTRDRMLLGLLGGAAPRVGIDATLLRVLVLIAGTIVLPLAIVTYLVAAAIVPRDDGSAILGDGPADTRDTAIAVVGALLGTPLVFGAGGHGGLFGTFLDWPVIVLASGALLAVLLVRLIRGDDASQHAAATVPAHTPAGATTGTGQAPAGSGVPGTDAPAHGADAPAVVTHASAGDDTAVTRVGAVTEQMPAAPMPLAPDSTTGQATDSSPHGESDTPAAPDDAGQPSDTTAQFVQPGPDTTAATHPKRRSLAGPVFAVVMLVPVVFVLLVVAGVWPGGMGEWAIVTATMAVIAAVGAIGIAVVRPRFLGPGLLILLAATLGTAAAGMHVAAPMVKDGVGERTIRVADTRDLRTLPLRHGIGELTIDARDLRVAPGSRTRLTTEIGIGEITVVVPRGTRVVPASGSPLMQLGDTTDRGRDLPRQAPIIELDASATAAEVFVKSPGAGGDLVDLGNETVGFWSSPSED